MILQCRKKWSFIKLLVSVILVLSCSVEIYANPAQAIKIERWQTKNGVNVYYVNTPGLPMLDVRLLFYAGSAHDGKAQGLAMLTNSTMIEGARRIGAAQVKQKLDQLGSQLNVLTGRQMAEIDLRTLTYPGYLKPSLSLLQDVLGEPAFRDADMSRMKSKMDALAASYRESPSDVAFNTLFDKLYPGQPYAHRPLGTKDSVEAITRDQLVSFYKKYYVAGNAQLLLVGDLSRQDAIDKANLITSKMLPGPAASALPLASPVAKAVNAAVNFPSTQTHIIFGQVALTYHDPGFYPLMVANYILGGSGLTSKLFKKVRDEKGLAYGISSYFVPTSYRGLFAINLQTKADKAQQAIALVRSIVGQYVKTGPTDQEVAFAVRAMQGQQVVNLVNHGDLMNALGVIATYHLPIDYYTTRLKKLSAVTSAEVKKALQNVLMPDRWVLVTVGPTSSRSKTPTLTKQSLSAVGAKSGSAASSLQPKNGSASVTLADKKRGDSE